MKNDTLYEYLNSQLKGQASQLGIYIKDSSGIEYPKRFLLTKLKWYIERFLGGDQEIRWVVIPGLRGVGKTTILAQLYYLFRNVFEQPILYISLDDIVFKLKSNLFDILSEFEEMMGTTFSELKTPVLLLIDEVHFDSQWQFALKSLYDKSNNVFVVCTGSSAIPLNISTDIVRRSQIEKLRPLLFSEYIMLSKEKPVLYLGDILEEEPVQLFNKLKKYSNQVVKYWQDLSKFEILSFLKYYTLPSTLKIQDKERIFFIMKQITERIIYTDIANLKQFSREVMGSIQTILYLLASSDTISLNNLSDNLVGLNSRTVSSILDVLEKSELLVKFLPYSTSIGRKIRKPAKYLFESSTVRAGLLHSVDASSLDQKYKGKLLEDYVGSYLFQKYGGRIGWQVSYDASENGADFIVQKETKKFVIETGWNKRNDVQIKNSLSKIQGDFGILITDHSLTLNKEEKILTIPLEMFFLLL
jgi:uncharacterized protein